MAERTDDLAVRAAVAGAGGLALLAGVRLHDQVTALWLGWGWDVGGWWGRRCMVRERVRLFMLTPSRGRK